MIFKNTKKEPETEISYFEIELEEDKLLSNIDVEEFFFVRDLKQRKLFLNSDISQYSIEDPAKYILQFNREDAGIPVEERKPILLYVASNGGEVDSGFELIDIIQASKTPVYTINLGYCYSMGFLIFLAGHKRYALKNSKLLMHDGSSFVYNSGSKVMDQVEFNKRVEERTKQYILERSNITSKEYDKKLRTEWYMFADEGKERGMVDMIIGQDCDIEEII